MTTNLEQYLKNPINPNPETESEGVTKKGLKWFAKKALSKVTPYGSALVNGAATIYNVANSYTQNKKSKTN